MKYAKYGTLVLMLAFLVGFSTPPAAAQQTYKGTFDLQTEAYWGPTLLPPGHYTVMMHPEPGKAVRVLSLTGEGVRAYVLAGPGTPEHVAEKGTLRLYDYNGVYVVRQLNTGLLGQSYNFVTSKKARARVEQASTPPRAVTVPVSTSATE